MNNILSEKIRYDGSRYADLLTEMRSFVANSCPGRKCPSQWQLAKKYGVSRSTVEKVLRQLAREGLIELKRGAGSFVAGRKTIQFLMPGENILTRLDNNGVTVRQRIDGCMQAARERSLGLELLYLSPNDDIYAMDMKRIASLNSSSMVILQDWFFSVFPELAKRSIRAALLSSGNVGYGYSQYTSNWQKMLIDRPGGIRKALEILYHSGCRRTALVGHYIKYCRALEFKMYQDFVLQHDMPVIAFELDAHYNSQSMQWRQDIARLYSQSKFDSLLLFCNEYTSAQDSLHEYFSLPRSVKIMAWNFYPELAPGIEPVPCFNPPNRQIAYDAVIRLLDDSHSRGKTVYQVDFKNLTEEMQTIYNNLSNKELENEIH